MPSAPIDPRGPRFAAVLTSLVLAAALITGSTLLLALQTLVFAAGALGGHRLAPYGWLFRTLVRPRLGPPAELEDPRPPRFAQGVGLAFTLLATLAALAGLPWLATALTAMALAAAFLNAAFDYCLGCECYLLLSRLR
ncbi:DUF4395 domain-containing protein [Kitasatospora sp. NA04385]|uniref:DUF4395 domain-containing protein n=1 Tax=Kitasatospora sp. NA04385 TaxID=2742135 RepID=UPI001591B4D5|nr:DUF4395 domain-containing protein [Kitasatospora sp. NA04385]QKW18880.1 DUF4395 domain-containing protein [Kitasatospora sp. NA04385]